MPTLVVFGSLKHRDLGVEAIETGQIDDPRKLAKLHAAADVFVAPSRLDNLPNTVVEAQSCGTPAVGFSVGGMPDAVGKAERLARPFDTADLAARIAQVLRSPPDPQEVARQAHARANPTDIAATMMTIYETVLAPQN